MKKLIMLTFALLFSAGMAFGQNNSETYQSGNRNNVTVDQTYQTDGTVTDANDANTYQNGNDNSIVRLHQVGAANSFDVTQNGNSNKVSVHPDQGGANGGLPSYNGSITINQTGNHNKIWDADQAGYNNVMTINQGGEMGGNNNIVNVEAQVNKNPESASNVITISQFGNNNAVGGYGDTKSGAYQEGSGNSMDITQSNGATAGQGTFDPANIPDQIDGPYDYSEWAFRADIEGGQGLIQLGEGNEMTINQVGENYIPVIYQNGNNNESEVTQNNGGTSNIAASFQVNADNHSTITQDGHYNGAAILQGGGGSNHASITQHGNLGLAASIQSGTGNHAAITQGGTSNRALNLQLGGSNHAVISQSGNGNTALNFQFGSGNHSTITQN
jgi:hypothetical protein